MARRKAGCEGAGGEMSFIEHCALSICYFSLDEGSERIARTDLPKLDSTKIQRGGGSWLAAKPGAGAGAQERR